MKIAVDVMGTDYGPAEIIKGVLEAVDEYGCEVVLVGDQNIIREALVREHQENNPKVSIHHASQVIEMKEHPGISIRKKRDASIVVATQLLHAKECDALVSSGSTGAAVAAALFGLGRIKGIERPLQRSSRASPARRCSWIPVPRWIRNRNSSSRAQSWVPSMRNSSLG